MKTLRTLLITFLLAFAAGGVISTTARADDAPSLDYFYDQLQPYGQWIQVDGLADGGYCWQPNAGQDPNWQPYTDGYWAYTDAGWTWVSYEDFGWITYHYGRWTRVEDVGWVWVPGYEWGPAWVSWRQSQIEDGADDANIIGWAPLPPEAHFRHGFGISIWADTTYDIGPGFYSFCRVRDFGAPVLGPVIIDRTRNVTIINSTTNITNITTNNNVVYNGGPDYQVLSRHADPAHPIQAMHLVRQTDAGSFRGGKGTMAQASGGQLVVAAPMIVAAKHPFKPTQVAKVYTAPKIDKGWAGTNPQQKLQIQNVLKAQTKGVKPQQTARPVTAQQLSVIPKGNAIPPKGPNNAAPGNKPQPAVVNAPTAPSNPAQPVKTPFESKERTPKPPTTPFNAGTAPVPAAPQGNPPPVKPPQPPANAGANAAEQQRILQEQKAAQQQKAAQAGAARQQELEQQRLQQQKAAQAGAARQQELEQQRLQQQKAAQAGAAGKAQELEQQKAAAAEAAAAHRQQVQQVQAPKPPAPPAQPRPPAQQPKPPGPLPPGKGGKPTPTPVP